MFDSYFYSFLFAHFFENDNEFLRRFISPWGEFCKAPLSPLPLPPSSYFFVCPGAPSPLNRDIILPPPSFPPPPHSAELRKRAWLQASKERVTCARSLRKQRRGRAIWPNVYRRCRRYHFFAFAFVCGRSQNTCDNSKELFLEEREKRLKISRRLSFPRVSSQALPIESFPSLHKETNQI